MQKDQLGEEESPFRENKAEQRRATLTKSLLRWIILHDSIGPMNNNKKYLCVWTTTLVVTSLNQFGPYTVCGK